MATSDRRPGDEIRADLATEEGQGGLGRLSPIGRLVNDVEPLLIENEQLHRAVADALTVCNAAAGDHIGGVTVVRVPLIRRALAPAASPSPVAGQDQPKEPGETHKMPTPQADRRRRLLDEYEAEHGPVAGQEAGT